MTKNLIQASPGFYWIRQWLSLSLLAALSIRGSSASAADKTWTTGNGGDGLWNNTANWGGATPLVNDKLIFGTTLGTTTLTHDLPNTYSWSNGALTGQTNFRTLGITFNSDAPAYTISGNGTGSTSLTVDGTIAVNSASNITQTINSNLTSTSGVTVTGAGNLVLGGSYGRLGTWTGPFTMNGTGLLTLNGSGGYSANGAFTMNSGTVLLAKSTAGGFAPGSVVINGGTVKLGAADQLKSAGPLTLNGGTLDLNGFDSQTLAGAPSLNGTGGLITNNAAGSGTNVLYIGNALTTSVYGGTISDGASAKVAVTVYDPGAGANFTVFSGKNNYSGGTIIRAVTGDFRPAVLSIADVANIGSAGYRNLTFVGSSATDVQVGLQLTGTVVTNSNQFDSLTFTTGIAAGIDVADPTNTFILGKNAANVDIAMTGAGYFLKKGAGTLEIDSNLAYTGATMINGGTLKINAQAGGALASTSTLQLNGGNLHLLGKTAGNGTTTQTLGNVSLGNPNNNLSGLGGSKITVDANGGSGTTLALGTLPNSTANGSTLNIKVLTGGQVSTTTTTTTNGLVGNGRIVFTDASNNVDFASIPGSGTRYIQAANYTGGTLPTSGSNLNTNYSHTGNASVTTSESINALKLTTSTTGQSLAITSTETLTLTTGGLLFTGAHDYSITGGTLKSNTATNSDLIIHQYGAGNLTVSSVIANGNGNSVLTKAGTGVLTLSGTNTYTGLTLVTGGTLSIASDSNIGGANGTFASLTSTLNNTAVTSTALSLPTGFVVGSTMLGRTVTAIGGSSGAYTITLSAGGANTTLAGGTASWAFTSVAASQYDSSGLWINSGGVLQATSSFSLSETNAGGGAGTTTANRRVTIGNGGGGFDVTSANILTVPGTINATGMMTKSGTGTLVLAGSNGITGGLTINGGTVQLANANALVAATSNLIFGSGTTARLQLNNNDAKVTSLVSSNTNAIVENGSSTAGTKTLTVYNGADNTYAGVLQNGSTGLLALAKTGGSTLTLSGTNTYTGSTTVSNGTLQVGSGGVGSTASGSAVSVNGSGAVLAGSGTVNGATTVTLGQIRPGDSGGALVGTFNFANNGSAALTLTGSVSPTTRATLQLGASGDAVFNDATGILANLANLTTYYGNQLTTYEAESGIHDRINVTGTLKLDSGGQIRLESLGRTLVFGDVLDLLDWGAVNLNADGAGSSFAASTDLDLPSLDSGLVFDRSLFASNGILVVVPEPSRALLLLAGLGTVLLRRRAKG